MQLTFDVANFRRKRLPKAKIVMKKREGAEFLFWLEVWRLFSLIVTIFAPIMRKLSYFNISVGFEFRI